MKKFRTMNKILLLSSVFLVHGCSTTAPIVKADKLRKKMVLQANTDKNTTMPNLKTNKPLNKVVDSINEKKPEENLTHLLNLSSIHLAQGDIKKAEKYCRKALRIDLKNIAAKKILANIYFRANNLDMANIILNGISDQIKKDNKIQNLLGLIALREGRFSDALANFNTGLKIDPTDISIRMNLGVLYLYYRQINQASLQFERVIKLMPSHSDAKVNLAIIENLKDNKGTAESIYEEVLSRTENPIVLFNYAVLEMQRKNFDTSLDLLKRYLNLKNVQNSNNEEVFALIDDIENQKRASGDRTTDLEIKKLADKLRGKKNIVNKLDDSQPKATKVSSQKEETKRVPRSEEELSDEDEISILEKELSGD